MARPKRQQSRAPLLPDHEMSHLAELHTFPRSEGTKQIPTAQTQQPSATSYAQRIVSVDQVLCNPDQA